MSEKEELVCYNHGLFPSTTVTQIAKENIAALNLIGVYDYNRDPDYFAAERVRKARADKLKINSNHGDRHD